VIDRFGASFRRGEVHAHPAGPSVERWTPVVIRSDPYWSWADIAGAEYASSTGSVSPYHLTGEIWIARLEFQIDGNIPSDATLRWNVDNNATVWINGNQVTPPNSGTWSTITTTNVSAAYLQSGTNTIAVKVTQDNNTNTWSINPTMFQAELAIPSDQQ
jgi:hypothetical protein